MTKFDDGTGVIRVPQQNTSRFAYAHVSYYACICRYDTAMNGANTFIGSYYVTALRASAAMAKLVGEEDQAKVYTDRESMAAANYEKICWREEFGYYVLILPL